MAETAQPLAAESDPNVQLQSAADAFKAFKFADAQTGQLDKANERVAAAIGIVQRCEARDTAAVRKARPKLFGLL